MTVNAQRMTTLFNASLDLCFLDFIFPVSVIRDRKSSTLPLLSRFFVSDVAVFTLVSPNVYHQDSGFNIACSHKPWKQTALRLEGTSPRQAKATWFADDAERKYYRLSALQVNRNLHPCFKPAWKFRPHNVITKANALWADMSRRLYDLTSEISSCGWYGCHVESQSLWCHPFKSISFK